MRPAVGWFRLYLVISVAYGAGAWLSWRFFEIGAMPKFYVPAGVTAAAMMLSPRARWPAIVAGIATAELAVDLHYGTTLPTALLFVVSNSVEPIIGASLVLAWCGGVPDLRRRADLAKFVIGGCMVGPLFGGLIGGSLSAHNSGHPWWSAVVQWWAGDGIGVLVVGAPILLWSKQSQVIRSRPVEAVLVFAATVALSGAAFRMQTPPTLLLLPVMAWAAFRLDVIGAVLAGSTLALTVNYLTLTGHGPFSELTSPAVRLAVTQAFIAVIVLVAMLTAQEVSGRAAAVRAREAERRERLRLEALSGLAQQLSASLTPADVGQALVDRVLNEAGASALNLGLIGADGRTLEWVVMEGYSAEVVEEFGTGLQLTDSAVAADAARTGEPVLIGSAAQYAQRYPQRLFWLDASGAQSVVGWPLTAGGTPIGVILLVWSEPQSLDSAQLAYISAVSSMVSQALVRAQIYADEHARALVLQAAVLPAGPAVVDSADVCVIYEPADVAQGLGGDWYDVMALPAGLPAGRTYFAVGDVVGHGLSAVEDMAQLRSAGRALAHRGLPPGELLAELNGFTRDATVGRFATMAVAVFDASSRVLRYCLAGHPPMLLRRVSTGEVVRLDAGRGPVLGPVTGASYSEDRVEVAPGDILMMYTDGLVERRGRDLENGIAEAARVIAEWGTSPYPTACQDLADTLAPRPRGDDVCILAVRFTAAD